MKSNNAHDSKSEHAQNESRDSHGKFTSEHNDKDKSQPSNSGSRGTHAEKDSKGSHSRMESKNDTMSKMSSHSGNQKSTRDMPKDSKDKK
ncbi:MAG: hypothetical protein LBV71_02470 [Prevotella sp.]|jgi:hypothetical protein|nr:hypothetical protein [Prevotella sp.]